MTGGEGGAELAKGRITPRCFDGAVDFCMRVTSERKKAARKFAPAGVVFAALGVALFFYFVRRAGVAEIADGMRRLGAGFILVLLASGVRPVVRSLAWTLCVEPPHRLRLQDAFAAFMTGDAVGNVVPFGMVIGEPAKAMLVRERGVPLVAGLSALAVEYIFYSLSVAAMIFVGALALLVSYPLPKALRWTSVGALAGGGGIVLAALFVMRLQWRFMSRAIDGMHRRGIGRRALTEERRGRVRAMEESVYGFYARNRSRFVPILLLESCFHVAGVAEVYVTLYFISDTAPTLLTAFVLETVNRMINVVFKFVPLRVGVDEAGTGMLTGALGLGVGSGVTLAIVRKARVVVWTALGILFLVMRGLSVRRVVEETEQAVAQRAGEEDDAGEAIERAEDVGTS